MYFRRCCILSHMHSRLNALSSASHILSSSCVSPSHSPSSLYSTHHTLQPASLPCPLPHTLVHTQHSPAITTSTFLIHQLSTHTHTPSSTHHTSSPTHPTPLPPQYITSGSVYVHYPYCRQRCSYCNFVKFIPRPEASWTLADAVLEDALAGEVRHSLRHSHITRVPSVFFGGGTPSLARPNMVEKVLQVIQRSGHLVEGAEVSLEVNPTSLETGTLQGFRAAGVNRVSIGVQSFDAASLSLLNRDHSASEARRCVETAQRLFPGSVSVDLMFGLPGQSVERWRREVQEAVALSGDHLSLYQLTVERGTALWHQVKAGEVSVPGADKMADLYEAAVQVLDEAGLHRYEVSNFAHHHQAESVHNKGYWQGRQYLGAGPGAHSRVVPRCPSDRQEPGEDRSCTNTRLAQEVIREARVNAADPASWLQETQTKGNGTRKIECQTRLVVAAEYLASGLRTREGVTEDQWSVFMPHTPLVEVFGGEVGWLEDAGLVSLSPEGLRATEKGLAVLDAFLPHLYNILHHHLT